MIDFLELVNFRAFKSQRFEFGRINIFVGPNNAGKSSALSALNLLAQTVQESIRDVPLALSGKYDDLGTFYDVVHGNNPRTRMSLHFGSNQFSFLLDFKYRTQRREIEVSKYEIRRNDNHIFSYNIKKDGYDLSYGGKSIERIAGSQTKRRPSFDGLMVRDPNLGHIRRMFPITTSGSEIAKDEFETLRRIDSFIFRSRSTLSEMFMKFDSLSPFRDAPRRTFLFSGSSPSQVGRTGSNAIDMIVSDSLRRGKASRGLVESISNWFLRSGMAKGIRVKTLTPRHYEVCVIGNDGSEHNLCDVGFGLSQVLPVLAGTLNAAKAEDRRFGIGSTFLVQEPEIHLHPNAQAELSTFFVETLPRDGQIFIETHSPDMVIRFQTHVARGDIAPKDLRVFYISGRQQGKQHSTAHVTPLRIGREGFFTRKWPEGFFPQREIESLTFARAAAKSKAREASNEEKGEPNE